MNNSRKKFIQREIKSLIDSIRRDTNTNAVSAQTVLAIDNSNKNFKDRILAIILLLIFGSVIGLVGAQILDTYTELDNNRLPIDSNVKISEKRKPD